VRTQAIVAGISITRSRLLATLLLFVNAMTWSYLTALLIGAPLRAAGIQFIGYVAYYLSTAVFALVGGFLSNRFQRPRVLYAWTVIGVAASCLPVFFVSLSPTHLLLLSLIWGASVGVGMPSLLSFLSSLTSIEERGRISGAITFVTYGALFPAVLLTYQADMATVSVLLAVWRLLGLIPLRYGDWGSLAPVERQLIPYSYVLRDRSFILYYVPWLTFTFVDILEQPVLIRFFGSNLYDLIAQTELGVGAVSALVGGLLLDFIGRKRAVIYSFVMLGLDYAVLGLGYMILGPAASKSVLWMVFSITDGVSWGILTTMFMFALWGDLSPKGYEERYYAIGGLPPSMAMVIRVVLAPVLELIQIYGAFSLASLFLFLAVVPLLMAPETLPEEVIEQRRMRSYIERAKEFAKRRIS